MMHDPVTAERADHGLSDKNGFLVFAGAAGAAAGRRRRRQQSVGPIQALFAAREAVGDIAGICERKPDVCETGKSAMHTIGARAKETAKIAPDMLRRARHVDHDRHRRERPRG